MKDISAWKGLRDLVQDDLHKLLDVSYSVDLRRAARVPARRRP